MCPVLVLVEVLDAIDRGRDLEPLERWKLAHTGDVVAERGRLVVHRLGFGRNVTRAHAHERGRDERDNDSSSNTHECPLLVFARFGLRDTTPVRLRVCDTGPDRPPRG